MDELVMTKLIHLTYEVCSEFFLDDRECITNEWWAGGHIMAIGADEVYFSVTQGGECFAATEV